MLIRQVAPPSPCRDGIQLAFLYVMQYSHDRGRRV
jgi:hypothetical protein